MNTRTGRSHLYRLFAICVVAHVVSIPASTSASGSAACAVPVPIVEYRFNDAGTTAANTGSDGVPVTFKNADGVATDLHGAAGSGVSGTGGDIAFDNSNPTPPSGGGDVGLGQFGGRGEQLVDDNNLDALTSFTLQGWLKANDPVSAESGRLFEKDYGVAPPEGGGFFLAWRTGGLLELQVIGTEVSVAHSPSSYLSENQWIFFAVTYDGTSNSNNVKFYRGTSAQTVELVGTTTIDAGTLTGTDLNLAIGNALSGTRAFPGLLDNMRIFGSPSTGNGALTLRQLEALRGNDLFPVPIVEYHFNDAGTTAANTGSDGIPVTFKNADGVATDLHGAAGSGVSGTGSDIAFDNSNPTPPSGGGDVGLGQFGGRGEQLVDDNNLDALTSFTLQGWLKANDPVSGESGRLFEKDYGVQPPAGGGFFLAWRTGGLLELQVIDTEVSVAHSPESYLSDNQWIFFAVTYDGTSNGNNVKFYRGTSAQTVELVGTTTIDAGTLTGTDLNLAIGNALSGTRAFPGLLDNMRIFGSASAASGALTMQQLESLRRADLQNAGVNESDADYNGLLDGCDVTPPVITPTVTGTLGNAGWYVSNVQTTWLVTDSESAVSSATGCSNTTTAADTPGLTLTCMATSEGGTSSQSVTFKRDATPPTAAVTANPPANSFGWRKTNVTVSFTGTDALSGGVTCDPQVVLSAQGSGQTASGRCRDAAGNQSAPATVSGINIDKTDPTVTITAPADGAVYNRNQAVSAGFSCADPLSGMATCVGSVASGQAIDTSKKINNGKFTVTATDKAGNSSKVTVTYSVK